MEELREKIFELLKEESGNMEGVDVNTTLIISPQFARISRQLVGLFKEYEDTQLSEKLDEILHHVKQ
jgi:hypothetical protein